MHLIIGFINVTFARLLASLYRTLRRDFIGQSAVRRCCSAYTAGAGLDDAAIEVLLGMGPDGIRLLESETHRRGEWSTAGHILTVLRQVGRT